MKNQFVKITLTLSMVLALLIPTQAFAAEKNCNLNQSTILNTTLSKINCTSAQDAINKLKATLAPSGKVDSAQLQNLLKQCSQKTTATAQNTPSKTTATAPSKTTATTPSKTTTSTTPSNTTTNNTTSQTPTKSNQTTDTSNSSSLGAYEQQVIDLVNKERAAAGLSALKANTKLASVAEKKAEDMRDNNYFSHTSPTYGSPFDMMKQFGISYTAAGENIAKGQKTPSEVMNGWMNSEGHRANILNSSYTEIGVGYVADSNGGGYWVQEFIRP